MRVPNGVEADEVIHRGARAMQGDVVQAKQTSQGVDHLDGEELWHMDRVRNLSGPGPASSWRAQAHLDGGRRVEDDQGIGPAHLSDDLGWEVTDVDWFAGLDPRPQLVSGRSL